MNTETEYRYLINESQYNTLLKNKRTKPVLVVEQHYLSKGENTIRIRKAISSGPAGTVVASGNTREEEVAEFYMTVKGKKVGPTCTEVETTIKSDFYESLLPLCNSSIRKLRTTVVTKNGITIELDRFLDLPLYIAEIELSGPGSGTIDTSKLPITLRRAVDITEDHRYSNVALSEFGVPTSAVTTEDVVSPTPIKHPEFNQRNADRLKAFYAIADAKSTNPIENLFNKDVNQFVLYLNELITELEDTVADTELILQSSSEVILGVMQELYNLDKKALRQLLSHRVIVKNESLINHAAYPIAEGDPLSPDCTISVLGLINGILHYLNDNAGSKKKLLVSKWNDKGTKLKGFSLKSEDYFLSGADDVA